MLTGTRHQVVATAAPPVVDVNVDPGNAEGEPEVAVDPRDPATVVVGENNSGVSVSHDHGRTWHAVALPNPGDNVLTVRPDGTFVYSSLDGEVDTSSDGGRSWSVAGNWVGAVAAQLNGVNGLVGREAGCSAPAPAGPVSVDPTQGPGPQLIGCDRPWLTADRTTGTLYMSFTDHDDASGGVGAAGWETGLAACRSTADTNPLFSCGRQYVAASHDGGRTWSAFHPHDAPDYPAGFTGGFSGQPVASGGTLATAYLAASAPGASCAPCVVFETSRDDGASWTRHLVAGASAEVTHGLGPVLGNPLGGPSLAGVPASALVSDYPSVLFEPYAAVDPSHPGRYALMLLDGARTHLLVHVTADSGQTWQESAPLSEPGGVQVWHPWIGYSPSGALGAMWRSEYSDGSYAVFAAVAPRGGGTFAPPVRLSSATSPAPVEVIAGDDASSVTLDSRSLHAAWGDHRTGQLSPWYARYDYASDPAVTAIGTPGQGTGPLPNSGGASSPVGAVGVAGAVLVAAAAARPRRRRRELSGSHVLVPADDVAPLAHRLNDGLGVEVPQQLLDGGKTALHHRARLDRSDSARRLDDAARLLADHGPHAVAVEGELVIGEPVLR